MPRSRECVRKCVKQENASGKTMRVNPRSCHECICAATADDDGDDNDNDDDDADDKKKKKLSLFKLFSRFSFPRNEAGLFFFTLASRSLSFFGSLKQK